MEINQLPFDEKDVKRVLTSPEGQRILALLNRDGGVKLREAANAMKNGDTDAAKRIISPLMETKEAADLVEKLSAK